MATNAAGCFERHDTGAKETTITQAGGVSLRLAGNASQEIRVPVTAAPTVLSIYAYADTNYGTTTPPAVTLLANGEIGVATQTVVMSPTTTGQWNQITLASFTPTAPGVVTLRLVGVPAIASGISYWDTLAAPSINTGDFASWNRGESLGVGVTPAAAGTTYIFQVEG